MSDDAIPKTATEWREQHAKTCTKRREQRGLSFRIKEDELSRALGIPEGELVTLAPGFDEHSWGSVGDDTIHVSVQCQACDATWSGVEIIGNPTTLEEQHAEKKDPE